MLLLQRAQSHALLMSRLLLASWFDNKRPLWEIAFPAVDVSMCLVMSKACSLTRRWYSRSRFKDTNIKDSRPSDFSFWKARRPAA